MQNFEWSYEWNAAKQILFCHDEYPIFCQNRYGETCPVLLEMKKVGYPTIICRHFCNENPRKVAGIISSYAQSHADE